MKISRGLLRKSLASWHMPDEVVRSRVMSFDFNESPQVRHQEKHYNSTYPCVHIVNPEHILSEVEAICERVIIINTGRIVLSKTMADLMVDRVIVVEVHGPSDQAAGVLKTTDGVSHVTPLPGSDGIAAFEVRPSGNQDPREAISLRLAKNGWAIRRLDLRRHSLENRFMQVIGADDPVKA